VTRVCGSLDEVEHADAVHKLLGIRISTLLELTAPTSQRTRGHKALIVGRRNQGETPKPGKVARNAYSRRPLAAPGLFASGCCGELAQVVDEVRDPLVAAVVVAGQPEPVCCHGVLGTEVEPPVGSVMADPKSAPRACRIRAPIGCLRFMPCTPISAL